MKNIQTTLARAVLVIAFAHISGNLFSQSPVFLSSNTPDNLSITSKDMPLAELKHEKIKLIQEKRSAVKLLTHKEDSLKSSIVLTEKEIKKNLIERDELASAAAALDKTVKSGDWASVNNQYKEKLRVYSALAKLRQEQKKVLTELQNQKELCLKDIQQEEVLLAKLKEKSKEESGRELAGN